MKCYLLQTVALAVLASLVDTTSASNDSSGILSLTTSNSSLQDASGEFPRFLEEIATPGLLGDLEFGKSWIAFGYNCTYDTKLSYRVGAGWQAIPVYFRTLTCDGLDSWRTDRGGYSSDAMAFKDLMKSYLAKLVEKGAAPKIELIRQVQKSKSEIVGVYVNELIAAITSVRSP